MDILERLQITLDGGLDSWPTASIEWEYGKAIEEIKKLTTERDKLKAALSECLTVIRPLSIRLTEEQKKLVPNMNAAHNLACGALKESA
jgi:hypothetical protein